MINKMLDNQLVEVLAKNGIVNLFQTEKICIPKIKSGNDLFCIAAEGCGKTTSIVLGVLQRLKKSYGDNPRTVIVVPDLERATAMKNEFIRFGTYSDLRINLACENEKIKDQKDRIYMGSDVVIGTIRRLNEIYAMYALNLTDVKTFIIDDAEEVIRSLSYAQITRICQGLLKTQYLVFAGTASEWIDRFVERTMNVQEIIEINNDDLPED